MSVLMITMTFFVLTRGIAGDALPAASPKDPAIDRSARATSFLQAQDSEAQEIFGKLEAVFGTGDANQLGSLLASKVYINLFTGENCMFSSNQTYFILKKLFEEYRMIALTFQTRSVNTASPYAMGQLQCIARGRKMSAQLYAALIHTDQGWKLNHLTISHQR